MRARFEQTESRHSLPGSRKERRSARATGHFERRNGDAAPPESQEATCFHCGTPCPGVTFAVEDKAFCCSGCRTVYEVLTENRLGHVYDLGRHAGPRVNQASSRDRFDWHL